MADARHHSTDATSVCCAVITVSDSRTEETDISGRIIRDLLTQRGHTVFHREIVPDHPDTLRNCVRKLIAEGSCRAIILTGGTGIASRDSTIEAIESLLEKRLDGFGELFRMLSYEQIGAAAMLSRAVGGTCNKTALFALPGSTKAVTLAMESLILPQLGHIAGLLSPD